MWNTDETIYASKNLLTKGIPTPSKSETFAYLMKLILHMFLILMPSCYTNHYFLATASTIFMPEEVPFACYSAHYYRVTPSSIFVIHQTTFSCYSKHCFGVTASIVSVFRQVLFSALSFRTALRLFHFRSNLCVDSRPWAIVWIQSPKL